MARITNEDKAALQKIKSRALRAKQVEMAKDAAAEQRQQKIIDAPNNTQQGGSETMGGVASELEQQRQAVTQIAELLYDSIEPVATPILEPWQVTQAKQATLCSAWATVIYEKMPEETNEKMGNLPVLIAGALTFGILAPVLWDTYRLAAGKTVTFRTDKQEVNARLSGLDVERERAKEPAKPRPPQGARPLARDLPPIVSGTGEITQL